MCLANAHTLSASVPVSWPEAAILHSCWHLHVRWFCCWRACKSSFLFVCFLWLVNVIVVPYWCKWCLLPCPQHALIMVQMGNFGVIAARLQSCQYTLYACVFTFQNIYAAKWPVLSTCMHLILFIWHVISMLCWMLSLSDSYPSKLWFLCAELHVYFKNHGWQNVYISASNMYASNPVYMIYNQYVMLDVKFEWCLLHHCLRICQMFILIAEYGLDTDFFSSFFSFSFCVCVCVCVVLFITKGVRLSFLFSFFQAIKRPSKQINDDPNKIVHT